LGCGAVVRGRGHSRSGVGLGARRIPAYGRPDPLLEAPRAQASVVERMALANDPVRRLCRSLVTPAARRRARVQSSSCVSSAVASTSFGGLLLGQAWDEEKANESVS